MVLKSLLRSMKVNLLAAANNGVAFWDGIETNNELGEGSLFFLTHPPPLSLLRTCDHLEKSPYD